MPRTSPEPKPTQDPLFVEVKFACSMYVPATERGDTWTVVMRGRVDRLTYTDKADGETLIQARVKADRAMRIDTADLVDMANEQLLVQVTSFLEAADYDAETGEVRPPPPVLEGQGDFLANPDDEQ